ncbi:extracellular matrix protein FRAS1-like [Gouania willdenowi]|uniref:extracellular matrix protein FRAS1-like n=1 Tax=Gouania willdenowi TaxID=441366 RepID=UPI0010542708|nr:extracellular matrix protein FRAS1-like [Gouania willdenowi]
MAGWFFVLWFFMFSKAVQGACVYKGSLYENNTSWRVHSCEQCSCYSDVVICRNVVCSNPQCDFSRGERLQIPSNQCCPQCISSSGSCDYEGVTYGVS